MEKQRNAQNERHLAVAWRWNGVASATFLVKKSNENKYGCRAAGKFTSRSDFVQRERRVTSAYVCCRSSFVVFSRLSCLFVATFPFPDYKLHICITWAIFVQNLMRFGWQFRENWKGVQFKNAAHSRCSNLNLAPVVLFAWPTVLTRTGI